MSDNTTERYVAKPFVAGSPEALVIGQTVLAFSQNLEAEVIAPLLPKHGLGDVDPEKWYPHQAWMDVLKDVNDHFGGRASQAFVAFGKQVVENVVMPPEIQTIPDVLNALHAIHHLNLQNVPEDEGYVVEQLGDKHYMVYENTPNPSYAIYGFIWGLVARYCPDDEDFVVEIVDNPKPAETPGTAFEIQWGEGV